MKVIVYNDRSLNVIYEYSTQNENDFEVMEFKFSSIFDNYNKKIVFLTPDGNISYYIKNNKFSIPREITQYEQVKFYIWCTFEDKDFRTKLKILSFYKNENVNIDILPLEKAQIEQIINELEKNILIVSNLKNETIALIDEIETKLKNGDFKGDKGDKGEPGESYDDTEIKEEISDIKEEQTTQNTRIEELEEQVQELENNQITGTATGQSIYIEDSTNTKVRSIGLSGNSEQADIAYIDTGTWEQGSIDGTNGSNISDNTYVRTVGFIPVFPNVLYNISRSIYNSYNVYRFYDSNKNYLGSHGTEGMVTTNQSSNRMVDSISSMTMTIINTNVAYMRIADNSNNLSTVYTISTSAPNPSYPQEIHSTGDSGSVNEKVQNKNLFDENKILLPDGTYTKTGDEIRISNGVRDFYAIDFKENTSYTISYDIKTTGSGNGRLEFYYTDGTTEDCGANNRTTYMYKSTTSNSNKTLQKIRTTYGDGGSFYLKNIQIEQGSTATDYTAHEEQNISFPLAQGQKLMEGDYLADDGIHHVRGEIDLKDLTWTYTSDGNRFLCNNVSNLNIKGAVSDSQPSTQILSNIFTVYSNNWIGSNNFHNPGIAITTTGLIRVKYEDTTDVNTFVTMLTNTNAILQYELAEEVIEPYTEEQQAVWEQIKNLKTYKPITHISSTDEVPATVDVTYVKDLETVINNLRGA